MLTFIFYLNIVIFFKKSKPKKKKPLQQIFCININMHVYFIIKQNKTFRHKILIIIKERDNEFKTEITRATKTFHDISIGLVVQPTG